MFTKIIEKLLAAGMTETQIAQHAGTSQPSVNRIGNGKQRPNYDVGNALVKLADERCPDWRETEKDVAA